MTAPHPAPRTAHATDVAIIGGGVIGCACAWALARAGAAVTLYERGRLAGEASGASAGILAPLAESEQPGPFAELAVAGLRAFETEIGAIAEESGIDPEYRRCGVIRWRLTNATPKDCAPRQAGRSTTPSACAGRTRMRLPH